MKFTDGRIEEFGLNLLAGNIFNKTDSYGWYIKPIDEVIDKLVKL